MPSSTQEGLDKEKAHVDDALLKNGYPRWLVRQYCNSPEKVARTVDQESRATISLPYVYGISDGEVSLVRRFSSPKVH